MPVFNAPRAGGRFIFREQVNPLMFGLGFIEIGIVLFLGYFAFKNAIARRYPNLHGDLSAGSAMTALNRDLDVTRNFIVEFQDRLLFARDDFGRAQVDLLEKLDLEDDVLEKVYHGNAERLVENAGRES